ncbi:MAG TPA: TldD/PmbA family protein, partial [Gemmatimonadaceae bacterium]|nr:TldD/PmbA family protein [Gemmatimonadaceae bacterium]
MTNRREFLKQGTLVAGAIAAEAAFRKAHGMTPVPKEPETPAMDAPTRDLMMEALNAAKLAGASYADVRIGRYLQNFVQTREQQITNVVDTDSMGAGVRALVD